MNVVLAVFFFLILTFGQAHSQEIEVHSTSLNTSDSKVQFERDWPLNDFFYHSAISAKKKSETTATKDFDKQYLSKSSMAGGQSSVFLRGQDSYHTAFFIDGMNANDPSGPTRSFDFGHLELNSNTKIKIYKGANNVRGGTDAPAGIISLDTEMPTTLGHFQKVSMGMGSFGKRYLSGNINGLESTTRYSINLYREELKGINQVDDDNSNTKKEIDGRILTVARGRIEHALNDKSALALTTHLTKDNVDLDNDPDGISETIEDDPNRHLNYNSYLIGTQLTSKFFNDYRNDLYLSQNRTKRKDFNDVDEFHNGMFDTKTEDKFSGKNITIKDELHYQGQNEESILFGFNHSKDHVDIDSSYIKIKAQANTNSVYTDLSLPLVKGFYAGTGFRGDDHNLFDPKLSTKSFIGWKNKTVNQEFVFSTGNKFPSVYQLFDSNYGNKNLQPEKIQNIEWSIASSSTNDSFSFNNKLALFQNKINDRFSYDKEYRAINDGQAKIVGGEYSQSFSYLNSQLVLSYTQLLTKDLKNNRPLYRRPKNLLSSTFIQEFLKDFTFNAEYLYKGKRTDVIGQLPGYSLYNINLEWKAMNELSTRFSLENAFNKKYQDLKGIATASRSFLVELTWNN